MTRPALAPLPLSELDSALTAQLLVGWAGEAGEEKRLGWWRCDLVSEFGGEDLFRRLLPATWAWATLQGAREAARKKDAELRRQDHNPDRLLSLFSLGYEVDARIEERLLELKRAGAPPTAALPGLAELLDPVWSKQRFVDWVEAHGPIEPASPPRGASSKASRPPPSAADPGADRRPRAPRRAVPLAPLPEVPVTAPRPAEAAEMLSQVRPGITACA